MRIKERLKKFLLDPKLYALLGIMYIISGILDGNPIESLVGIIVIQFSLLVHLTKGRKKCEN